MNDY